MFFDDEEIEYITDDNSSFDPGVLKELVIYKILTKIKTV